MNSPVYGRFINGVISVYAEQREKSIWFSFQQLRRIKFE